MKNLSMKFTEDDQARWIKLRAARPWATPPIIIREAMHLLELRIDREIEQDADRRDTLPPATQHSRTPAA